MTKEDQRRLGQILVERKFITQKQLDEALAEQELTGRFMGEILISRGAANEEEVIRCLSEQLGFAFVDLSQMSIEPKAKEVVPEELCRKYTAIPLFITQNTLTIAMSNPLDVKAIDEIQSVSGFRLKPVFACPSAIRDALEKKDSPPVSGDKAPSLEEAASISSVVNKVDDIITKAVKMGASDIHLEPERNNFLCRYRIDGILYTHLEIPLDEQGAIISRIKIMANMDIADKRLPQDGRLAMNVAERDVDLRVSTFPTLYGENLVIRILDRSRGIIKLEQLGFSQGALSEFSKLIHRPYGIILVTGPTGSGKTTTLYAALSEINTLEKNIITLEDPIEYEIPHIRQSQVNVKAGLSFATGLRSIVRQDPDIIMIGEIRDKETADIAIHAALTGHLVFSTLHTNDAVSSATRLIDMGVEPFLVASSIIGILAQRLVRNLCPSCKQEYKPSSDLLKQLGLDPSLDPSLKDRKVYPLGLDIKDKYVFYKENGCQKCHQRGYLGRAGIFELLIPNDRIKDLITQKAAATALRNEAIEAGMKTLRIAGLEKVAAGLTSVSELLRVTEEV